MLSVELGHLADVLDQVGELKNVSSKAREWSARIKDAIWQTTVRSLLFPITLDIHDSWQVQENIFAYETNGFGGRYIMDDANVPVCSQRHWQI